jgi:serine/threonine-protein kinase RsbW
MVELTFWTELHALCIKIVDHGTWRPPPANRPVERGRGIELMRQLAQSVDTRADTAGTTVVLQHPLPGNDPDC